MNAPPPPAAPGSIQRQPDGRHAVLDANGNLMGLHKSVWSAARQMHNSFPPDGPPAEDAPGLSKGTTATMQTPTIPHPPKTQAKPIPKSKIPTPKGK